MAQPNPHSEIEISCSAEEEEPNPDCPGCVTFAGSNVNEDAIDQCASSEGDGVVTAPGDYDFDPVYVQAICENYYGGFRFGLNASSYQAGGPADAPVFYTTVPSLFIPPQGTVLLNSSCPTRITKQLAFDYRAHFFGVHVDYEAVTPATFQSQVIDDWNSTGAHGQRPPADPDGTQNGDIVTGGYFDCRFLFTGSGSNYASVCNAFYQASNRNPISGVALLTDDGTNPTITGYGLLVDLFNNLILTVKWEDSAPEVFTILDSQSFLPTVNDQLKIQAVQECPCPYGSTDPSSVHPAFPKGGEILAQVLPEAGGVSYEYRGSRPSFPSSIPGSLPPEEWATLGYGCLMTIFVDNGFCDNEIVWRDPCTSFVSTGTSC